jgi:hypothetical protein
MEIFNVKLQIAASVDCVMGAYWSLKDWPNVAPHVQAIQMHYADDAVQVLTMTVASRQRVDAFKTVRIRKANTIHFFQPDPPPILLHHTGCWQFEPNGQATLVTIEHAIEVNLPAAKAFLGISAAATTDHNSINAAIRELICNNSLQTMRGLKNKLETEKEHQYALTN